MDTYSTLCSSSSSSCSARHNYSHRHLQSLPAEAMQKNTHEGLFSSTRNYLQSDHSHISSSSGLSHEVFDTKNKAAVLNSGDLTSENSSLFKIGTGDIDHNRNNVQKKEAMKVEEGGDDDDDDDEGKNGVNVEKRKGEKKVRRPRFAFQTRSQVDILDDGYRWRKYGQKAVKNNNFPRSYYRCTYQGCNVKKQVQRLSKDEEVVVTTYEGIHTHPIERNNDNFEQILNQMQIYTRF